MPDEIPRFDDWIKTQDPNRQALSNPRVKSFLDKIGKSEGADYNTLVGGSRINDLSRHPNKVGLRTSAGPSTAFGKYQIVGTTDRSKLRKYRDLDYSPENQDLRAVELLRQTGALEALERGDEATAIKRAGREWASIPGSPLPGRKNTAAFRQQQPAKPSEVPRFDDWVATQEQPTEQSPAPRGRLSAMAEATPVVRRPRVQTGQVEDSGLGPQFPKGTTRGAATSRNASLVGQQRTPRISRADFNRADRDAVRTMSATAGTYDNIDPRLAKGEQPSDPMAYAKAQELVGRVEPIREVGGIRSGATAMGPRNRGIVERITDTVKDYAPGIRSLDTPMGIKTDPIRGALSLGMVDARRTITPEEKLVDPDAEAKAETAYQVGSFVPAVVPYAAAGKVISKIPSLNAATREAHIARSALTFGGVELGRELARSAQTGEPLNPQEVAISTAIGGGIGGIAGVNPGLKKQLVAFITPGVVADVARGTDPETATFNALTNLAFGLHSYKGAPREVQAAAKLAVGESREPTKVSKGIRGVSELPIREEVLPRSSTQVGAGAPELRRGNEKVETQPKVATDPALVEPAKESPQAGLERLGVSPLSDIKSDVRQGLKPPAPVRHVDVQARRTRNTPTGTRGQFKRESALQKQERQAKVNPKRSIEEIDREMDALHEQGDIVTDPALNQRYNDLMRERMARMDDVSASGGPQVVYHGSTEPFKAFELRETYRNIEGRPEKVTPQAHYFSTDKDTARMFARDKMQINERLRGLPPGTETVRPYTLDIQKPLDFTITDATRQQMMRDGIDPTMYNPNAPSPYAVREIKRITGYEPETWNDVQQALDDPRVVRALKQKGYDGARLEENDGSETWAVFNAKQIKPVSPLKPDIPPAELSPRRPSSAPPVETPTSPTLKEPSITSGRREMMAADRVCAVIRIQPRLLAFRH